MKPKALLLAMVLVGCIDKPPPSPEVPPPPFPEVPPQPGGPLAGLVQSSGGAFTISPDGGALSVLYDAARLQWLPKDAGDAPKSFEAGFTIAGASRAQRAQLTIRGFRHTSRKDGARLGLRIGEIAHDLTPQLSEGNFTLCASITLAPGRTHVRWRAELDRVAGEQSDLSIDGIDIASPGGEC